MLRWLGGNSSQNLTCLTRINNFLSRDNESRKMCTINIHKGLYQYFRLPFGIASAPAIFQKLMDSVLQGVPRTVCYIDDILVIGGSEDEHLMNLELVLERLKTHGITVRKSECVFMANSVEFLGHRIDAEGLHPLESKIETMVKVPQPRNVAELKSFLGMVNYYSKFLHVDNYFPVIRIAEEE